jgi:hypothetical protein
MLTWRNMDVLYLQNICRLPSVSCAGQRGRFQATGLFGTERRLSAKLLVMGRAQERRARRLPRHPL